MTFGQALDAIKQSRRVTRAGWKASGVWLRLHKPNADTAPYVYMSDIVGALFPWTPTQEDMLAEDWVIVEGV